MEYNKNLRIRLKKENFCKLEILSKSNKCTISHLVRIIINEYLMVNCRKTNNNTDVS